MIHIYIYARVVRTGKEDLISLVDDCYLTFQLSYIMIIDIYIYTTSKLLYERGPLVNYYFPFI